MPPRFSAVLVSLLVFAAPVRAEQPQSPAQGADAPLTREQIAVACAMTPEPLPVTPETLTITGSQDPAGWSLFGTGDMVVVSGGTARHVDVGQRYFVRRGEWFGPRSSKQPYTVQTGGWIRIVAANEAMAIGRVEYSCSDIRTGDFLEPFAAPEVPATASEDAGGTLDFSNLGHVLYGDRIQWTAGGGGFMLIDRGTDQGASVGARYAVYRDLHQPGVPLVAIGEVVVVSAGPSSAVVRVTGSRGAVMTGDYIVPRR
jgi:hypothetical protein